MLPCHSNENGATIAYPPNSAQLEGTSYHSPSYIRSHAVVWACGERKTDTQTAVTSIGYISRRLRFMRFIRPAESRNQTPSRSVQPFLRSSPHDVLRHAWDATSFPLYMLSKVTRSSATAEGPRDAAVSLEGLSAAAKLC